MVNKNISNEEINLPDGWWEDNIWSGFNLKVLNKEQKTLYSIRTNVGIKTLNKKCKILIKNKKIVNIDYE